MFSIDRKFLQLILLFNEELIHLTALLKNLDILETKATISSDYREEKDLMFYKDEHKPKASV